MLRGKKAITNGNTDFQDALDDALNYQNIEKDPQKLSKLKPILIRIIGKG